MSKQLQNQKVMPLAVEEAHVSKEDVVRGKFRIQTKTETTEQLISTELGGEKVEVVRVAVNRYVDDSAELPQMREEDGILIVPIFEEVAIVEKRLVLKEELHITRRPITEIVDVPVTLRKQQATLERLGNDGDSPPGTYTSNTEKES
jgi:uncharacterized protein (TIGR02271 family)